MSDPRPEPGTDWDRGEVAARCAVPACRSRDGVELHHLYSRKEGCPDDLVVPLCHVCHGRAHGMKRRINISALIADGLARARAEGKAHGRPRVDDSVERHVRRLLREGMGIKAVAAVVGVGVGTVQRIAGAALLSAGETGQLNPTPKPAEMLGLKVEDKGTPQPVQLDVFSFASAA